MKNLVDTLSREYPHLSFSPASRFSWSPETSQINYQAGDTPMHAWKLLHELAHALLKHLSYSSDIELLQIETAAWEKAVSLSGQYGHSIADSYIQDCLDTYRDWIHQRSTCPQCNTRSLQHSTDTYRCFNCLHAWHVSTSRFCRPYRQSEHSKTSPSSITKRAMFA